MQYYYGTQNILRALDEAEFWKHQEADHAGLIPIVSQGLEVEYVNACKQFALELNAMNAEVVKFIQSINRSNDMLSPELVSQIVYIVQQCIEQSQRFINFMADMLQHSHAISTNQAAQGVLHHMIRESQYFIGIDQLVLNESPMY